MMGSTEAGPINIENPNYEFTLNELVILLKNYRKRFNSKLFIQYRK